MFTEEEIKKLIKEEMDKYLQIFDCGELQVDLTGMTREEQLDMVKANFTEALNYIAEQEDEKNDQ